MKTETQKKDSIGQLYERKLEVGSSFPECRFQIEYLSPNIPYAALQAVTRYPAMPCMVFCCSVVLGKQGRMQHQRYSTACRMQYAFIDSY